MNKYIITSLAAFGVTYFLTPLVLRAARRLGVIDRPGERRIHKSDTPRGGGLAIFVGFHAAFLVFFAAGWEQYAVKIDLGWWKGFAAASGVLLLVGLADDARGIRPWIKLAGQVTAAVMMYLFGARFGNLVAWELSPAADLALTVFWFVAITNAFNLVDGLDGLATGLALISALGLLGALFFRRLSVDAVMVMAFASSCLAFLRYNFHPAKVFLGDSGSMFLGFALAAFALETSSKGTFALTLGAVVLAMGIPVFDTLLAIWRRSVRMLAPRSMRTGRGGGLMTADNEHLHHRLLTRMGQRQVASILFTINAVFVLVALLTMAFQTHAYGIYMISFVVGSYVVIRHLANVELWDTGHAIVEGLHAPKGRVVVFLLYPFLDLLLLTGVLVVVLYLFGHLESAHRRVDLVLQSWPLWVAPVFLALFAGRIYSRVWAKARLVDYLVLVFCVAGGTAFGLGLQLLSWEGSRKEALHFALLFGSLGQLVLIFPRAAIRGLRELLSFSSLNAGSSRAYGKKPVLLYGTGPRLDLFLREKAMRSSIGEDKIILGILADDTNLRNRLVNGYRVLGGLESLVDVIRRDRVAEIVVLDNVSHQVLSELHAAADEFGLRLSEWLCHERVLREPSGQGSVR